MANIVDREFSELTDRMIVAHEVQGRPLSTLAGMLNRSLGSVLDRFEELVLNGKYTEYKDEILNYQNNAVAEYSSRHRHYDGSPVRTEKM